MNGFGRHIGELPVENSVKAVYYEMIGQTFAVLGMAFAKVSLSLFLLRIVVVTWHKAVLWFAIVSIMIVSISVDVVFWVQCLPSESIYDKRVKGKCTVSVEEVSLTLGCMWTCSPYLFLGREKCLNTDRSTSLVCLWGFSAGHISVVLPLEPTDEKEGKVDHRSGSKSRYHVRDGHCLKPKDVDIPYVEEFTNDSFSQCWNMWDLPNADINSIWHQRLHLYVSPKFPTLSVCGASLTICLLRYRWYGRSDHLEWRWDVSHPSLYRYSCSSAAIQSY